jgi:pyruvate formate lyase activating enzyme
VPVNARRKDTTPLTRREFLKWGTLSGLGLGLSVSAGTSGCSVVVPAPPPTATVRRPPSPTPRPLHEMRFYRTLAEGYAQCEVCFRRCVIRPDRLGFCANVKNVGGKCYSLVYGLPCALQTDPIEKEPAFHMLPGATIYCTATASCNFQCQFCQNWELSQQDLWHVLNTPATPDEVVTAAQQHDCQAVSFTYNDPIVFYDYMVDIAQLAQEQGLRALFHTNGSLTPRAMEAVLEVMDGVVVDLKGFTNAFYQRIAKGELMPVLDGLQIIAGSGRHLELVHLIIPTLNDDSDDIRRMCEWTAENLGDQVPVHFIRFFPSYKLQRLPPTPVETLERAIAVADDVGLRYVYIGNVPSHRRNSTFCPHCGACIIERVYFFVVSQEMEEGHCRFCGHPIPGIWA